MRLTKLDIQRGSKRFDTVVEENEVREVKPCHCGYSRAVKAIGAKTPGCVRCGRKAA